MSLRFIDWIWHIRGSLALAPGQSSDDAFDRLDPLFRQPNTSHERTGDALTFNKKDQAAQDKMSIFDDGVLRIEKGAAGSVLRYDLTSRALLYCFLAPLLFLGFAQLTIAVGKFQKPSTEAAEKAKKEEKKKAELPQHWIDKALGAPAPEKPKKDDEDKKKGEKGKGKGKDKDKEKEKDEKPSPTPAYVFAAIFATLYVAGRILEDRLIKALFKRRLLKP
ncbi:MAG: hypothetical protein ACO1NM_08330 [Sphingobium phenoxybenzoativorans]